MLQRSLWRRRAVGFMALSLVGTLAACDDTPDDVVQVSAVEQGLAVDLSLSAPTTTDVGQDLIYTINFGVSDDPITDAVLTFSLDDINGLNTGAVDDGLATDAEATYGGVVRQMRPVQFISTYPAGPVDTAPTAPGMYATTGAISWAMGDIPDGFVDTATVVMRAPYNVLDGATIAAKVTLTYKVNGVPQVKTADTTATPAAYPAVTTTPYTYSFSAGTAYRTETSGNYLYNAYANGNRDVEGVRFKITSSGTCTPTFGGAYHYSNTSGVNPSVVSTPSAGADWTTTYEATVLRSNNHPNTYVQFGVPATCPVGSTVVLTNQGTIFEGTPLERTNTYTLTWTVADRPPPSEVICPTYGGADYPQKSYTGLLRNNANYSGASAYYYYAAVRPGEAVVYTHNYAYPTPTIALANRYQITVVPSGFAFAGYPQGVTGNVFKDCAGTALEPSDPAFDAVDPTSSGWYDVAEAWTGVPFTPGGPVTNPTAEAGPGCRILVQAGATSAGHVFYNYPLLRACTSGESCFVAESETDLPIGYAEYSTKDDGNPVTFDTVKCYGNTNERTLRRKTEAQFYFQSAYLDEQTGATSKAILAGDSLEFSFGGYNYQGASEYPKGQYTVDLSGVKTLLDLPAITGSIQSTGFPANGQNVVGERCKVSDIDFIPPDGPTCLASGGNACLARWVFPAACQPANGQAVPRMKLIAPILRTVPAGTSFSLQATMRKTDLSAIGADNASPRYFGASSNSVTVTVLPAPSLAVTQSSPLLWPADSAFLSTQVVTNQGNVPLTGIYTVAQVPQAGVSGTTVTPGLGRMFVSLPATAGDPVLEASSDAACFTNPTSGTWTELGGLAASSRPGFTFQSVNPLPVGTLCTRVRLKKNALNQIGLAVTQQIVSAVEFDTTGLGDGEVMVERARAGASSALFGTINLSPVNAQDLSTTISSDLAVVVSKTAVADPNVAGRTRWIIQYVNRSGVPGSTIEITDTLPTGASFAGLATPLDAGEACTSGGAACGAEPVGGNQVVRFEIASIGAFDGAPDQGLDEGTIELFTQSPAGATDITNCAVVTASTPVNSYTIPGCASTQESAIALTKQVVGGLTEVAEGAPIPYRLVAQNTGTQPTTVTVTDTLPAGTTLVSGTIQINGATASDNLVSGGVFRYTYNRALQPSQTLTINLALAADNSQVGQTVINTGVAQGCLNPLYPATCAVAVASAGVSVSIYADADGDGVENGEDSDPNDPHKCKDDDSDTCDDCAVTGADGSGGDPQDDGTDTDFDGFCDAYENDFDNDGVCDVASGLPGCEGGPDTVPGDPNRCRDLDGDTCDDCAVTGADRSGGDPGNDGADSDHDGICNAGDIDSDNDGVCDGAGSGAGCVAGPDSDPYDPSQCRDVDADGCDDCTLGASGGDPANDGLDSDSDGVCNVGDPRDLDPFVCGDGDHDTCDDCTIAGTQAFDNDGADADADQVCNPGEAVAGTDPNDADTDDDGVRDGYEPTWWVDSDEDGLINARDPDSDDDGLYDGTELGVATAGPGTDPDAPTFVPDADAGATTTDPLARDTDRDGIPDGAEDDNHDGQQGFGETNPLLATPYDAFVDSDGDFLSDAEELFIGTDPNVADSDGDGVWDGYEPNFGTDTDGDGLINALDNDSDNDGIPDGIELLRTGGCRWTSAVNADTDGGGLSDGLEDPNHNGCFDAGELDPAVLGDDREADADGDGIADLDEGTGDLDADGTPDYLDLDVDGDGILDAAEAGDADPQTPPADTDGDGTPDFRDLDVDGDGIADADEAGDADPQTPPADTDGDGTPDFRDDDVDGDGILDVHEAGDADPQTPPADTDGDGTPDFRDDDVDGDGRLDVLEAGDGDPLTPPIDTDGDGTPDFRDADADDDGVLDGSDNCRLVANPGQEDANSDGIGDACDGNADGDALPDGADNCPNVANDDQADADGDDLGDVCDADADGDLIADLADNCPGLANTDQLDRDHDGAGNACDADDDGDGVADAADNCPLVPNADQADGDTDGVGDACAGDADGDGVRDGADNCVGVINPGQGDLDDDGQGDACDLDDDADGALDPEDNCPLAPNPNQEDGNGDGLGDACSQGFLVDGDGDGVVDDLDNCPTVANADQADTLNDGVGDACRVGPDLDQDGILDVLDSCPRTPNPDQLDTDQDSIGDACDPDLDGDGIDDELTVSGSASCATGGSASSSGLLVLALLGAVGVRRRRRRAGAVLAGATVAVVGAAASSRAAHAQAALEQRDFAIERFRWSSDAGGVLGAEAGTVGPTGMLTAGLSVGTEADPLVIYNETTDTQIGALVERRIGAELRASYVPLPRLQVGLSAPIILSQSGQTNVMGVANPLSTFASSGFGDLTLAPKLALMDGGAVDLAARVAVTFPTGGDGAYRGEGDLSVAPELCLSRVMGPVRLAGDLGYRARDNTRVLDLEIGDELFAHAAVAYRLSPNPIEVQGGFSFATPVASPFQSSRTDHLEAQAGAHIALPGPFALGLAAGVGMREGFGTPDWRLVAGIEFRRGAAAPVAPPPPVDDDDFETDAPIARR